MSAFGQDPTPPPASFDELLGGDLTAAMDRLEIMSRKVLAGKLHGERQSRRKGFSIDFAEHRPYVAGDDLRYVDWNVYARLDALFLKLYLDEEDLSVLLAIDASASMDWGNPSKWTWARRMAGALGGIALAGHQRVTVATFNDQGVSMLRDLRGRGRTAELGSWLLGSKCGGKGDLDAAIRTVQTSLRGRGVVVLLSDFWEQADPIGPLQRLAGQHDLHCVQVLSPQELDPGGHGLVGDLALEDAETGKVCEVTVTPALLRTCQAKLQDRVRLVREAARRAGGSHVAISTAEPVADVLTEQLRRSGLLR